MKKKWVTWVLYAVVGYIVYKNVLEKPALASKVPPPNPPPPPPMPYDRQAIPPDAPMKL